MITSRTPNRKKLKTNRTTNMETSRKANSEIDGKTNMNKSVKAGGKADRTARSICGQTGRHTGKQGG